MSNNTLAKISELDLALAKVQTISEARKLLAVANSYASAAAKILYNVDKISDCKEDKEQAKEAASKYGEIKMKIEARLGQLIIREQEAGNLATQGQPKKSRSTATLKEFGLTKSDSSRAKMVYEHQDLIPQIVEAAKKKDDVPTRAALEKQVKKDKQAKRKEEQIEAISKLQPIEGKYNVVVIDPPWNYENRNEDVTHSSRSPYPQMSITEIQEKVPPCADDCFVWLWTTNSFMHEAFHILAAWGLEPKTILTWKKNNIGLGDWLRGQTEHCILAVKGHPVITLTNQSTFLEGEAREHSRKPEAFYKLVETLCHGSKCEMYGREKREGWFVHGLLEF